MRGREGAVTNWDHYSESIRDAEEAIVIAMEALHGGSPATPGGRDGLTIAEKEMDDLSREVASALNAALAAMTVWDHNLRGRHELPGRGGPGQVGPAPRLTVIRGKDA